MSRFELDDIGDYEFVEPVDDGTRAPRVFTEAPKVAVPGDLVVAQTGGTAEVYVFIGPDQTTPDRPPTWAPLQAPVGDTLNGPTIELWQAGTEYTYPDLVLTGNPASGYLLWMATTNIPAATPEPGTTGANGWAPVGGGTTGFRLKTAVANAAALPTTGNAQGDLISTLDDGHIHLWGSDNAWHDIGAMQGPQGPPGADGASGAQGPAGADGPQGPPGPQGDGIKLLGSFSDVPSLPTVNQPGDAYVVESTGDLAVWGSDGQWHMLHTIVGPTGAEGPQGPVGPTGPVTPMVIVEGNDPPANLPLGALFFDIDADNPIMDLENRIAALEALVAAHATALTSATTRLDGHDGTIAAHDAAITAHGTSIAALQTLIDGLRTDVDALKAKPKTFSKFVQGSWTTSGTAALALTGAAATVPLVKDTKYLVTVAASIRCIGGAQTGVSSNLRLYVDGTTQIGYGQLLWNNVASERRELTGHALWTVPETRDYPLTMTIDTSLGQLQNGATPFGWSLTPIEGP